MKRVFLFFFLLCIAQTFAQTEENSDNHFDDNGLNELKLNVLYSITGFPEISYERLLNDNTSLGLSLSFSVDDDIEYNAIVLPYFRFFFGKKPAAGFFFEANAAFISEHVDTVFISDTIDPIPMSSNEFGFGLGFAIGGKFLNKSGWVGEVFGGAGRNFSGAEGTTEAYPRFGISIGKRF